MTRTTTRAIAIGAAGLLALAITGCSQQMRAERDGRDLAESICDLKSASDADAAQAAIDDIAEEIDDLVERYGVATAEDAADIQNNLADLAEHAVQGNEVLVQQDIAVLQRSAENIREDVGGLQESVWTGFSAGLEECLSE